MRSSLFIVFALVMLMGGNWAKGEESAEPSEREAPLDRKLLIAPSSTTVSLGKASLTVKPLTHKGKLYVGDYQLKVVPYYFKSEEGRLELEASDETVQKLIEGVAVKFKGTATNNKDGKSKVVTGSTTPVAGEKGSVTFSVETDNGQMVFKTSYHFGSGEVD